jgi:hypothetical protein
MEDDGNKSRLQSLFNILNEVGKKAMFGYELMQRAHVSEQQLSELIRSNDLNSLVSVTGSSQPDKIGNAFLSISFAQTGKVEIERYVLGRQLGLFDNHTPFPPPCIS